MVDYAASQVTKAEILIALSHALDLVEGQPAGHAARTCLISSRIASVLGLSERQKDDVYFATLLKDAGCSSNAARIHKIFGGDDFIIKHGVKLVDWSNPIESLKYAVTNTERGGTIGQKLRRMVSNLGTPAQVMDQVTLARCTRGSAIARKLGFSDEAARAVELLDEHWDGKGSPYHLRADKIPLEAQIVSISQTIEVFYTAYGIDAAVVMAKERQGSWFAPNLVQAFLSFAHDEPFWRSVSLHAERSAQEIPVAAALENAAEADIDQICEAFAMIVDAKSSFTAEHSSRVTDYALLLGKSYGFDSRRLTTLRRASLLHDIGKLGVSNKILEKPGKLDDEEFAIIRQHSKHSWEILKPIRVFQREAEIASAHHERLDGSGYWRGLRGDQLHLEMRILAVADVFDALSAERPYRGAMPRERVFEILDKEADSALDADCVARVKELTEQAPALAMAA